MTSLPYIDENKLDDYYNLNIKAQLDARVGLDVVVKATTKYLYDYVLEKGYDPGPIVEVTTRDGQPTGVGFHFSMEPYDFADEVRPDVGDEVSLEKTEEILGKAA